MQKLPSFHPLSEFRGSPRACGRQYGNSQAEAIGAFLAAEVPPNRKRLHYASLCWKRVIEWDRPVAEFIRGMAEGARRPIEEITLLLLHEEIAHTKKCTAFGATGQGTRDGAPLIGQNWDWSQSLYPWANVLRLCTDSGPATLTYTYPGLWASAGINEHGLSLVWTSAGLFPKVQPRVGIPSYALIAAILGRQNCRQAISLLKKTPNAGCFVFLLADAEGEVWVVEGISGRTEAVQCVAVIGRANHYECTDSCRRSKQRVPKASLKANTRSRRDRLAVLLKEYNGKIDGMIAQTIFRDHAVKPGLNICQHPVPGRVGLTLDSMYALPVKKEFWIARGAPCRHEYKRYKI